MPVGELWVWIYVVIQRSVPVLHAVRPYDFVHLQAGDMNTFARHFKKARDAGLGITLHISEVRHATPTFSAFHLY